jgi:hypothetical protein
MAETADTTQQTPPTTEAAEAEAAEAEAAEDAQAAPSRTLEELLADAANWAERRSRLQADLARERGKRHAAEEASAALAAAFGVDSPADLVQQANELQELRVSDAIRRAASDPKLKANVEALVDSASLRAKIKADPGKASEMVVEYLASNPWAAAQVPTGGSADVFADATKKSEPTTAVNFNDWLRSGAV